MAGKLVQTRKGLKDYICDFDYILTCSLKDEGYYSVYIQYF